MPRRQALKAACVAALVVGALLTLLFHGTGRRCTGVGGSARMICVSVDPVAETLTVVGVVLVLLGLLGGLALALSAAPGRASRGRVLRFALVVLALAFILPGLSLGAQVFTTTHEVQVVTPDPLGATGCSPTQPGAQGILCLSVISVGTVVVYAAAAVGLAVAVRWPTRAALVAAAALPQLAWVWIVVWNLARESSRISLIGPLTMGLLAAALCLLVAREHRRVVQDESVRSIAG